MKSQSLEAEELATDLRSTILYVDDDPDDQEFFIDSLQGIYPQVNCIAAENGMQALDLLKNIPVPKCIFIDINMPLMNGIELLQILKTIPNYASIPAFIISTSVSDSDKSLVKELGALNCIIKPTSQQDLTKVLKNTLETIQLSC